jgi:hypothetical protein
MTGANIARKAADMRADMGTVTNQLMAIWPARTRIKRNPI